VQKQTSLAVGHQLTVAFQLAVGLHPFAQYGPENKSMKLRKELKAILIQLKPSHSLRYIYSRFPSTYKL
jgi:hypothetical protein